MIARQGSGIEFPSNHCASAFGKIDAGRSCRR
jgi:hypothetical protein